MIARRLAVDPGVVASGRSLTHLEVRSLLTHVGVRSLLTHVGVGVPDRP